MKMFSFISHHWCSGHKSVSTDALASEGPNSMWPPGFGLRKTFLEECPPGPFRNSSGHRYQAWGQRDKHGQFLLSKNVKSFCKDRLSMSGSHRRTPSSGVDGDMKACIWRGCLKDTIMSVYAYPTFWCSRPEVGRTWTFIVVVHFIDKETRVQIAYPFTRSFSFFLVPIISQTCC